MMELIYGIHPVIEMLRAGRRTVSRAWLADSDAGRRLRNVRTLLDRHKIILQTVDRQRLRQLCGSAEHQGVVVECSDYPYAGLPALCGLNRVVLLDNLEDPGNVGAVLRSALFFGWRGILLPVRGVPGVYPSMVKASAGATEHLLIARDRTANRYLRWLRDENFSITVLEPGGKDDFDRIVMSSSARLALVVGGEHRGVGHFIRMNADNIVSISGQGPVESLNAAVAAGIALCRMAVVAGGAPGRNG